jgi:hypothetical protein
MVALVALLGVHEGRFAWGLLGLVAFALFLVGVALVVGTLALRRSRRALAQVAALAWGQARPEPEPREPERGEGELRPIPPPPPPPPMAAEPEIQGPPPAAAAAFEPAPPDAVFEPAPPEPPPAAPTDEDLCRCGHARRDHFRITAGTWMCLANVIPACQCRQFVSEGSETAHLLQSLRHPDELVRAAAAADLRGRPEATEALLAALDDDSARVRLEAVRALEDAPQDAAVSRALIDVIAQDLAPAVREQGVRVLASVIGRRGRAGAA